MRARWHRALTAAASATILAALTAAPASATPETDNLFQAVGTISSAAGYGSTGPGAQPLPLSQSSLGQVFSLYNLFSQITSRWGSPSDLASLAANITTNGPISVYGGTETITATAVPASGSSTVDQLNITLQASVQANGLQPALANTAGDIVLNGGGGVNATATVTVTLPIRYDTSTGAAWLAAGSGAPTMATDVSLSLGNGATGHVGVLAISTSASSVSASAHYVTTLGVPSGGEVGLYGSAPAMLSNSNVTTAYGSSPGSISGNVQLTGVTGGVAALSPLTQVTGALTVSQANVASGSPTLSFSGTGGMDQFRNVTASDLVSGLQQMAAFVRFAQVGAGDFQLPLMTGKFSDAFDASAPLQQFLADHVAANGNSLGGSPDFDTVQALIRELDNASAEGITATVSNVTWNQQAQQFEFPLQLQVAQSNIVVDPSSGQYGDPDTGAFDAGTTLAAGGISGLSSTVSTALASPSYQLNLDPVLNLSSSAGVPDADRVMLDTSNGSLPLVSADVPITSAIDANGSAGSLAIHAAGSLSFNPPAGGHTLSLTLKQPGPPYSPLASLADLMTEATASPSTILTATHGGSLTASLGIDVPSMPSFFGTGGCANSSASSCTDVNLSWPDITSPSTINVTGGGLSTLQAFTLSGQDPADLISKARAQLQMLSNAIPKLGTIANGAVTGPLNATLPLTGRTLGSFIDTSQLDSALAALDGQSFATLDQMASALDTALGNNSTVKFSVQGSGNNTELLAAIDEQDAVNQAVPLTLSLGSNGLVGSSGSGQLDVTGNVTFKLTVAIDVNASQGTLTPTAVQVLPNSSIDVALTADASGSLGANVGPLVLSLGQPGDPAQAHLAVDLALSDNTASTAPISFATWAQALAPSLNSNSQPVTCDSSEFGYGLDVCADLPLYVSANGGQSYHKLVTSGNDDLILRLPANDPTFDPTGPDINGPNNGDPALPRLDVPDLSSALSTALLSFSTLSDGFDAFMGVVKDGLQSASDNGKLPFIGSDLQEGENFVGGLQSDVDAAINSLPDPSGVLATNMGNDIQTAISSNLGSLLQSGVTVGLTCGGGPCQSTDLATSITKVTVAFDAGSGPSVSNCATPGNGCAGFSIPLNLGIPGLSLRSTNSLTGAIGWHLHVAVGLDDQNGFFVEPGNDLQVGIGIQPPNGLTAQLSVIQVKLTDLNSGTVPAFEGLFDVGLTNSADEYLDQLLDDGSSAVHATLSAQAKADWRATATVNSAMPGLSADFHLDWGWSSDAPNATVPTTLSFDNVSVVPGELISGTLGPVARQLNTVLGPMSTVLDYLQQPLPVVNDLSQEAGGPTISASSLLGLSANLSGDSRLTMANRLLNLATIIANVNNAVANSQPVPIGQFDLDPTAALAGDAPDQILQNPQPAPTEQWSSLESDVINAAFPNVQNMVQLLQNQAQGGFQYPVLDNPASIFGLLLGENVDIITYDAGSIHEDLGAPLDGFDADLSQLLPLDVGAKGDAIIDAQFRAGYDTYGLSQVIGGGGPTDLTSGLYIDTKNPSGQETPNLNISGNVALYASASAGLASAEVDGGLDFDTGLGTYDADGSGKFRPALQLGQGFGCAFAAHSNGDAFLNISATVGISPLSKTWAFNVAKEPLWDLSSSCPPPASYSGGGGGVPYVKKPPLGTFRFLDNNVTTLLNDYDDLLVGDQLTVNGVNTTIPQLSGGANTAHGLNNVDQVLMANGRGDAISLHEPDGSDLPIPTPGVTGIGDESNIVLSDAGAGSCTGDAYFTGYLDTSNSYVMFKFDGSNLTQLPPPPAGDPYALQIVGATPSGTVLMENAEASLHQDGNVYELVNGSWENLDQVINNGLHVNAGFGILDDGTMLVQVDNGDGTDSIGTISPAGAFTVIAPGQVGNSFASEVAHDGTVVYNDSLSLYHAGHTYTFDKLVPWVPPSSSFGMPAIPRESLQQQAQLAVGTVSFVNGNGEALGWANNQPVLITIPSWATNPTRPAQCTAPGQPTNLTATPGSSQGEVDLSWTAPSSGTSITAYHIYRYSNPQNLVSVATVSGGTRSYADMSSPAGGTHYAVSAENPGGEGDVALVGVATASAQGSIDPTSGGSMTLPGGLGSISFPPGAVATPTTINYVTPAATDHASGALQFLGQTFTLDAGDSGGDPVSQFGANYTLTLHFSPSQIPAGSDPTTVNLYYYSNGAWQPVLPCGGCSLDLNTDTITVQLDHFTDYALMVGQKSSGNGGGGHTTTTPTTTTAGGSGTTQPAHLSAVSHGAPSFKTLAKKHTFSVLLANHNRVAVAVRATFAATLVPAGGKHAKTITVTSARATIKPGAHGTITLKLPTGKIATLVRGHKESFKLTLVASAANHASATTQFRVSLPVGQLKHR
jgi:hypothetical protein